MKLYSYVISRDFGFAPNPFFGVCTLATCKPIIRKHASVGDWVIGTGSAKYGLTGRLVYAMEISEIISFDEYWNDPRFLCKRPYISGSLKQAYGDNIYHQKTPGMWIQHNSHHTCEDGKPNIHNINRDTKTPNVLIGTKFIYWGKDGPKIPKSFTDVVCTSQGHKCRFSEKLVEKFTKWIIALGEQGYLSDPAEF